MSDSENTNYIENDSEDSFHPDEESSSNDSDEPSASSKKTEELEEKIFSQHFHLHAKKFCQP